MTIKDQGKAAQIRLLHGIYRLTMELGKPPTYREIKEIVGWSSLSNISYHAARAYGDGLISNPKKRGLVLTDRGRELLGVPADPHQEIRHIVRRSVAQSFMRNEEPHPDIAEIARLHGIEFGERRFGFTENPPISRRATAGVSDPGSQRRDLLRPTHPDTTLASPSLATPSRKNWV